MIKYLLSTLLILAPARNCGGQVQVGGTLNAIPSTIQVTLNPATIGTGGSSILTANQQMTDGSLGVLRTAQCQWTSATPGVATISPVIGYGPAPTVVAVAPGTSLVTCTDGLFSGSAIITVAAPPAITNPVCGTPPCVLPQGINSVVYSGFTFAQSGCSGTNTWTVSVGTINTGLTLSTAGVISGTPTVNGTSTFTVQDACSSPAGTASVQVSLTIIASTCGPPNFNCSSPSTAVITQPTQPAMPSINSTGYAYSAPTDPYYPAGGVGNCYTALSNATSRVDKSVGQSIHASWSGGGGNVMWDVNRAYGSATDDNGNVFYFHVHYDVNGCMQMDSDMSANSLGGGTGGGFTFSRVTGGVAYKVATKSTDGTKSKLYQENLTGTSTVTVTRTLLFDYNNCPGLDGTFTTQGGNGNLNVDYQDRYYSTTLNFPPAVNGQNGAHWVLVWDRTLNSCATYYTGQVLTTENPANGNIWTWCTGNCSQHGTNPAPLALNTLCDPNGYGIHGVGATIKGEYALISGACIVGASSQSTFWRYGLNDLRVCHTTLYNCGGHGATGFAGTWSNDNNIAFRSVYDLTTWTVIRPLLPGGFNGLDQHGAANWIGAAADVNPWLTSTAAGVQGRTCTINPYCDEVIGIRHDGTIVRIGPNFFQWSGSAGDLGPIMAMAQDGYCVIFESTWNGTRGLDIKGNLRKDLFALCNMR